MSIVNLLKDVPAGVVDIVVELIGLIIKFVKAGDDEAAQEAVLMDAQEKIKAEMDRRRFGTRRTDPPFTPGGET